MLLKWRPQEDLEDASKIIHIGTLPGRPDVPLVSMLETSTGWRMVGFWQSDDGQDDRIWPDSAQAMQAAEHGLAAFFISEMVPTMVGEGAAVVLHERMRQMMTEGFNVQGDADNYRGDNDKDLLLAATCYLRACTGFEHLVQIVPNRWPFDAAWWKPGSEERNLEKAAALIMAHLDKRKLERIRDGIEEDRKDFGDE